MKSRPAKKARQFDGCPMTLRLPEVIKEKAKEEARMEGISMAAVIRRLIIRHYQPIKGAA